MLPLSKLFLKNLGVSTVGVSFFSRSKLRFMYMHIALIIINPNLVWQRNNLSINQMLFNLVFQQDDILLPGSPKT